MPCNQNQNASRLQKHRAITCPRTELGVSHRRNAFFLKKPLHGHFPRRIGRHVTYLISEQMIFWLEFPIIIIYFFFFFSDSTLEQQKPSIQIAT